MYDNILNRPLRFIGNVSERARNLIEQVLFRNSLTKKNQIEIFDFILVITKSSK